MFVVALFGSQSGHNWHILAVLFSGVIDLTGLVYPHPKLGYGLPGRPPVGITQLELLKESQKS